MSNNSELKNTKIAVVGNYLPRQCGIATFTTDLSLSLIPELEKCNSELINIAMNDSPNTYKYCDQVKFVIEQNVKEDYIKAADFLNTNGCRYVIVEHEFGIFGGKSGQYIIELLKRLDMKIIVNLHTVLEKPNLTQRKIMQDMIKYCDKILVMSKKAFSFLEKNYSIKRNMIAFIPHGILNVEFQDIEGKYNKEFFNESKNKDIILTFGLLSPSKGIEVMVQALPEIIKQHPNALYVVAGKIHPNIYKKFGDEYKINLKKLAKKLKVEKNLIFHDNFFDNDIIAKYIQTSKVYVIPYLNEEQITSGTLSFALGTGAAIVSTPFWHARELLASKRGVLIPFNNPSEMANKINHLLDNEKERKAIKKRAYEHSRNMIWESVAKQHLEVFKNLYLTTSNRNTDKKIRGNLFDRKPEIDLTHLKVLTDDTGIMQHARYSIPFPEYGYCSDDNARALIFSVLYYKTKKDKTILPYINRYLSFLLNAFNEKNKCFRNFMSYDRKWLEDVGSQDSQGRVLLSLGTAILYAPTKEIKSLVFKMFHDSLENITKLTAPRSCCFAILGLINYLKLYSGDTKVSDILKNFSNKIYDLFEKNSSKEWLWFEETITYANAIIPHSLILAGKYQKNQKMFKKGIEILKWLLKIQTNSQNKLSIIGNDGWYTKNKEFSKFDQQPIEAMCLINACRDAYSITKDEFFLKASQMCFGWFLGDNDLGIAVCNLKSGGCFDGLGKDGVNFNQGAESSLAWLISLIEN